jgi:hypothetical protein
VYPSRMNALEMGMKTTDNKRGITWHNLVVVCDWLCTGMRKRKFLKGLKCWWKGHNVAMKFPENSAWKSKINESKKTK